MVAVQVRHHERDAGAGGLRRPVLHERDGERDERARVERVPAEGRPEARGGGARLVEHGLDELVLGLERVVHGAREADGKHAGDDAGEQRDDKLGERVAGVAVFF